MCKLASAQGSLGLLSVQPSVAEAVCPLAFTWRKKKIPGRDGSFRDIYLQHFLSEVYQHMNSVGKPLTVTLKKKKAA